MRRELYAAWAVSVLAAFGVGRCDLDLSLRTARTDVALLTERNNELVRNDVERAQLVKDQRLALEAARAGQREALEALEMMRIKARWLDEQLGLSTRFTEFAKEEKRASTWAR